MSATAIVLLSGGLDSAVCAALAKRDGLNVHALSFLYGQRHSREVRAAFAVAKALGIKSHEVVEVSDLGGSPLTGEGEVPIDGVVRVGLSPVHVPGRNTVFVAHALAAAERVGAESIWVGWNSDDAVNFPDCRIEYAQAWNLLLMGLRPAGQRILLKAPLLRLTKAEIVHRARELRVPIDLTWSCYSGGEEPCGKCDACRLRERAMEAS